ncbi:hypothetical protein BDV09DRAFT_170501 [Aspergillus tetrazonus]
MATISDVTDEEILLRPGEIKESMSSRNRWGILHILLLGYIPMAILITKSLVRGELKQELPKLHRCFQSCLHHELHRVQLPSFRNVLRRLFEKFVGFYAFLGSTRLPPDYLG